MINFMQTFKQDIKNDVRLYFAPVIGAIRQVKAELYRSSNTKRQLKVSNRKQR